MQIEATWSDEELLDRLSSVDTDEMWRSIEETDTETKRRCYEVLGYDPPEGIDNVEGVETEGEDLLHNGLDDGSYPFRASGGEAYVYDNYGGQQHVATVQAPYLGEGDYGTIESRGGQFAQPVVTGNVNEGITSDQLADELDAALDEGSEWESEDTSTDTSSYAGYGDSSSEESEYDESEYEDGYDEGSSSGYDSDPYEIYRTPTAQVVAVWNAAEQSKQAVRALCEAADSSQSIPFLATSNWVFFGQQDDTIVEYFKPVALTGYLRFTRNRTRPNVFSLEGIRAQAPPDELPTDHIGTGDDNALAAVETELRTMVTSHDIYPYRDRDRITITTSA